MLTTVETRTVTNYTLILNDADAQLAMDDPFSLGEKVREALLAHMPKPKTRKPKTSQNITVGKGKRGKLPVSTCAICEQEIATKFLSRHIKAKHSQEA